MCSKTCEKSRLHLSAQVVSIYSLSATLIGLAESLIINTALARVGLQSPQQKSPENSAVKRLERVLTPALV